jgi:hypothetical protein
MIEENSSDERKSLKRLIIVGDSDLIDRQISSIVSGLNHSLRFNYIIRIEKLKRNEADSTIQILLRKKVASFRPDLIYLVGDNAFEMIFPLFYNEKIFYSHLSLPIDDYKKRFGIKDATKTFGIVHELRLEKLFDLFNKISFDPNKVIIFSSNQVSLSKTLKEKVILQTIQERLKKKKRDEEVELFEIENSLELKKRLRDLNNERSKFLLVNLLDTLPEFENGRVLNEEEISTIFVGYNMKHLELGKSTSNSEKGLCLSICKDEYKVGLDISSLMLSIEEGNSLEETVLITPVKLVVNLKRLRDLKLETFFNEAIKDSDFFFLRYIDY